MKVNIKAAEFLKAERVKRLKAEGVTATELKNVMAQGSPVPRAELTRYAAFLIREQKRINREIYAELAPLIASMEATRQDSIEDQIRDLFTAVLSLEGVVDRFLDIAQLSAGVTRAGRSISAFNTRKYSKKVYRILGLNTLPAGADFGVLNGWTAENIELIKGVNGEQVQKIKTLMYRAARDGSRAKEINGAIARIMGSSVKRAALIARDQTLKLSGQLDRLKQTNAGILGYIWHTSRDERVRPKHQSRNGKRFRWDKPPEGGHPGQDVQCRCTPEPDLETLLGRGRQNSL